MIPVYRHSSRPASANLLSTGIAAVFLGILLVQGSAHAAPGKSLGTADLERIGKRIWQNECDGTMAGLTSWNTGEDFASLGIGHFIWYPAGKQGPFEESFPMLLKWFQQRKIATPAWLAQAPNCPWPDRATFMKDRNSTRQKELRELLARTVAEQTSFIIDRLETAASRFQTAAGRSGKRVAANMQLLRQTAAGNFAMIDYVNFKGEGLKPEESYKGEGWGLLHVLIAMETPDDAGKAPRAFADAAKRVLKHRVENSPPERKEERWLGGWLNRCETYAK